MKEARAHCQHCWRRPSVSGDMNTTVCVDRDELLVL